MLLAQCRIDGLRLLTMDRALVSHPLAANCRLASVTARTGTSAGQRRDEPETESPA
jgi:hypothetical protein